PRRGRNEGRDQLWTGCCPLSTTAYGRAQARVRLTCPPSIVDAAERYRVAVQAFDDEMVANVGVVLKTRNVNGVKRSVSDGVVRPQDRLVDATREATGRQRPGVHHRVR